MAQAQATRTWVSGVGDDVNPCSRTAPCKTYAGAISKTAKDGEISTLDPGGFGTITITKSITINGGGGGQGYGSILSALAPQGVLVNITDAADIRKAVKLDWLNINGASTGTHGIRILSANSVSIENTVVDGVTTNGVDISAAATSPEVSIVNSTFRNCASRGFSASATSPNTVTASISHSNFFNNGTGVLATNNSKVSCYDCVAAGNATNGYVAQVTGAAGNSSQLTLEHCVAFNSGTGIAAGGGVAGASDILRVSDSSITNNATAGFAVFSTGQIVSFNDNIIEGNGPNVGAKTPGVFQ
jgi:hypothetical protein